MKDAKTFRADFERRAENIRRFVQNDFPKFTAVTAVNHFRESWTNKGFTDGSGLFSAWQDVRRRAKPKTPADLTRGILIGKGSGILRASVRALSVSAKRVQIGTDRPYAKIHNEGGEVSGTASVRAHSRRAHSRRRGKKNQIVKAHSVKAHSRKFSFTMPKRQFLGESKPLTDSLQNFARQRFRSILE